MSVLESIAELSKTNPMLASAVGIGGAGVLTYFCKDVPLKLTNLLKKHLTTSLTISNSQLCYFQFMQLFENQGAVHKLRNIKFMNGRWGCNTEVQKTVGNGTHFIWYKGHPLWITVSMSQSDSLEEKLVVTVDKLGRSHALFDDLQKEFSKPTDRDPTKTRVYRWSDFWSCITSYPVRNLDTVFLEKEKKDELLSTIDQFIKNEDYYLRRGIPYQLGILLWGEPGSGKTSLIAALAGYFNRDIYLLSPGQLSSMQAALGALPENCFVVIEDIDTNLAVHARQGVEPIITKRDQVKASKHKPKFTDDVQLTESKPGLITEKKESDIDEYTRLSLSDILNSLDGLIRCHGRVMIMTTNRKEKLDAALLRGGRTDLEVYVGLVVPETFMQFMNVFFDGDPRLETLSVSKVVPVSMSTLQTNYLAHKPYEWFIEQYVEQE